GHEPAAVRLSSGVPFAGQLTFVQPPRTVWPPAQAAGKVRWDMAKFVPLSLVRKLVAHEHISDEQWVVEPSSECLLPLYKSGPAPAPFRLTTRTLAPVDREDRVSRQAHRIGALEFNRDSGFWFLAAFADDAARTSWSDRIRGAVRLLADSGIGGGRSRGWGRSLPPRFENVDTTTFLPSGEGDENDSGWWMLSLFSPAQGENIGWSRGNYSVVWRSGRDAAGLLKPASRMIAEGSVLTGDEPRGTMLNVAVEGAEHRLLRSGLALAVRVASRDQDVWRQFEQTAAETAPAPPEPTTAETEAEALPDPLPSVAEDEVSAAAELDAPTEAPADPDIAEPPAAEVPADSGSDQPTEPEQEAQPQGLLEPGPQVAGLLEPPHSDEEQQS
ncbi:MAG TPA: hypothetical protein VES20_12855, partial [Bryobacteraceae bacterium]|nr:hypothetical protein [Bryobacteraceae bacterium]